MPTARNLLTQRFGDAAHGVRWALSQVPETSVQGSRLGLGNRELLLRSPARAIGDGYAVSWSRRTVRLTATTPIGTIAGLLEIARQIDGPAAKNVTQRIRFKTRFYKHEVRFEGTPSQARGSHAGQERPITQYSDRLLEAFFQELARRHFNAVVVYAGYHPFEHFLDYHGLAHASDRPAAVRKRNLKGLTRFFEMARKYGLRTFLHHYVSHFTQALADHLKLGLSEAGARLAACDHPAVDAYNRYVYRRTFETLPALDGLFMNFESAGSAARLMKRTLFPVANRMRHKPALFFRLWGFSDVEAMKALLAPYSGPKGLIHKSHETADVYYYPSADDRVKVWKHALPDVEFAFSIGPCHNCGTNISRKLWTDPDYVHALLASIERKGADSISFQSTYELLLSRLPDAAVFPRRERDHARVNVRHLDAVVDYVRGEKPSHAAWATRYADNFATSPAAGEAIRQAIVESSQIILKQYRQFCYGSSQEGYLYPGRFSHYQEPFFYYPMSFVNRIGRIPHNVSWRSWAVRDRHVRVLPEDTQAIIDYVNPQIRRKPVNHPRAIVRQIRAHIRRSTQAVARYRRAAGPAADRTLIEQVGRNCANGKRIWREIEIACQLYSCYFAGSKASFFRHLRRARDLMLDSAKVLGSRLADTDSFCATTASGPYKPREDAGQIAAILSYENEDVPFAALRAYLRSHERYNEIRRLCRPYVSVRGRMVERNRRLLRQAMSAAEESLQALTHERHTLYRDNILAWAEYLRAETDWLTPPAMICPPDDSLAPDEGFRAMVHDQCYRWGQPCWEDFASFFRRHDFFSVDRCDCRATYTRRGLKLSLREHGIDWAQRTARWDANRGTINQSGFMRIRLDPGNTGSRVLAFDVHFEGQGGMAHAFVEHPDGRIESEPARPWRAFDSTFQHTDSSWRCDVEIPWRQLGARARTGDRWRLNILSNPSVLRNRQVAWCQAYEYRNDVARLGHIVFT